MWNPKNNYSNLKGNEGAILRKGNPKKSPEVGNILILFLKELECVLVAQFEGLEKNNDDDSSSSWMVRFGADLLVRFDRDRVDCLIWGYVPHKYLDRARAAISASHSKALIMQLVNGVGVKVIISAAAYEATFGEDVALTSGLATLGRGDVVYGGFGMIGGIVVINAGTGLLSAHTAFQVCRALDATLQNTGHVAFGGLLGATLGVAMSYAAVFAAAAPEVQGAAVITSGLASLGGGSIAAGGGGMIVGLVVVAAIPVATVAVVGGVTYGISRLKTNGENLRRYLERIGKGKRLNYKFNPTPQNTGHVAVGGLFGATLGVAMSYAAVLAAAAPEVQGAAVITSGLASLGGGSIAAGGGGMIVGLVVVAAIPVATVAVVGGVTYGISHFITNFENLKRYRKLIDKGKRLNYKFNFDPCLA